MLNPRLAYAIAIHLSKFFMVDFDLFEKLYATFFTSLHLLTEKA